MSVLYDFSMPALNGGTIDFGDFRSKVVLIVNTASACGFTPQYQGLQALSQAYGERGLVVVGCPCNQFGAQEPGNPDEIRAFCQTRYGVSFPLSAKIEVNGDHAHPLFQWLTQTAPGLLGTRSIKWNFTKFLVNRNGRDVRRFPSTDSPESLKVAIEELLAEAR